MLLCGNNSRRAFGRKIPINAGDKSKDIFMQTLQLSSGSSTTEQISYEPVDTISIWYDENEYTLTLPEIEKFIGQAKNGFSRNYWTRQHRPRLKTLEYNIRMWALASVDGLVINRSEGRSGRLSVSPNEAIQIIRSVYL
jgi:hypothetical protein